MLVLFSVQTSEDQTSLLDGLLLRTARGEREAFAQLYRQTRAAVYGLALSLLHDAQEAQDVTQDVFVKVWENAGRYRSQGTPMAWLLTVARNEARMRLRREGREVTLDEETWNAIPAGEPDISTEDRLLLQEGLSGLEPEERRILLLRAGGLKHREVADLLELPLSTVLSKYHRGLKKLKSLMKGESRP